MLTPQETQCFAILHAAATSAFGLVVYTNNVSKVRAALYRARKDLNDPELASLHIRVSPDDSEHELWIIRRGEAPGLNMTELL